MIPDLSSRGAHDILVINALNGVFPLVLRKRYPEARITCAEIFPFYKHHLVNLGFDVVDWEGLSGMKFDIVVGNPPYLKGTWKTFLEKSVDLSTGLIYLVAPDATNNFSNRSDKFVDYLKSVGIQKITDCTHFFPNVSSGKIVMYHMDVNKEYDPECLQDQSPEGNIVKKVISYSAHSKLNAMLSSKRSAEHANSPRHAKRTPGCIKTLISIGKNNVEWAWVDKQHVTILNADQYWFTNRYFGRDADSPLVETTGNIGISHNILAIEKIPNWSLDEFSKIYLDPVYRFVLTHLRQGGFDTSPRHLKQLPILKLHDAKLYAKMGLDQAEVSMIKSLKS